MGSTSWHLGAAGTQGKGNVGPVCLSDAGVPDLLLRTLRWSVAVVGLVLVSGCGGADDGVDSVSTVSTVEVDRSIDVVDPDRTAGSWIVEGVTPETSLVFDTAAASVEVQVGCRLLLGSFTFLDPGRVGQDDVASEGVAGFTLPGRSTDDCPAEDDEAAAQLTDRLQQVDRWMQEDDRLAFEGPQGRVVLRPAD